MDDDLPRSPNDPLNMLIHQDLDPLSVAELEIRIQALKKEIIRCENKKKSSAAHRADAENLFR